MSARIAYSTIVAEDFLALADFYRATFDLVELDSFRNGAFIAFDGGGVMLSFTPTTTYFTLGIDEWSKPTGAAQYLTFEVDSDAEVEARSATAVDRGGRLVRQPYETRYRSWQTVLADPENNVFRIQHVR